MYNRNLVGCDNARSAAATMRGTWYMSRRTYQVLVHVCVGVWMLTLLLVWLHMVAEAYPVMLDTWYTIKTQHPQDGPASSWLDWCKGQQVWGEQQTHTSTVEQKAADSTRYATTPIQSHAGLSTVDISTRLLSRTSHPLPLGSQLFFFRLNQRPPSYPEVPLARHPLVPSP